MSNEHFLGEGERPDWFAYPEPFTRVVEQGLIDLTPWYIIDKHLARARMHSLKERYPDRDLVPFAKRDDNDDVACFERGRGDAVAVIHDFAASGFETKAVLTSFWDWFRYAIEEMILFES